jgi:hypothetical protein
MLHARHLRLRRAATYLGLLMALGIASLTLSQCRAVSDRVSGVGLFRGQPTTCIKQCNDQYKLLYDEEQKLHATNLANCQALPPTDQGPCLQAEDARHTARMAELGQQKIDCQNNCHHQGAGGAN